MPVVNNTEQGLNEEQMEQVSILKKPIKFYNHLLLGCTISDDILDRCMLMKHRKYEFAKHQQLTIEVRTVFQIDCRVCK